jgi:hypothetical protein
LFPELNSYFSVPHSFAAYLQPWAQGRALPTEDELKDMQSPGLQLLTEVKALESDCLLQLRHLDNDAKAVVDFLKLQSRKVDLVLQHVLEKQVHEGDYFQGEQFGGSGISIISPAPLAIGHVFQTHVYIRSELVAVFCFCTVVSAKAMAPETDEHTLSADNEEASPSVQALQQEATQASTWFCELEFSQILDSDVEQLVKASLNVQQKILKQRKKLRDKK